MRQRDVFYADESGIGPILHVHARHRMMPGDAGMFIGNALMVAKPVVPKGRPLPATVSTGHFFIDDRGEWQPADYSEVLLYTYATRGGSKAVDLMARTRHYAAVRISLPPYPMGECPPITIPEHVTPHVVALPDNTLMVFAMSNFPKELVRRLEKTTHALQGVNADMQYRLDLSAYMW